MFPLRCLAPVAERQLAAWEAIARDWPLYEDGDCERCASCHQNVIAVTDVLAPVEEGTSRRPAAYAYTDEQRLALVVAHLRQAHMDLDPDR